MLKLFRRLKLAVFLVLLFIPQPGHADPPGVSAAIIPLSGSTDFRSDARKVLIINSYHQGFKWTRDESEAVADSLESLGTRVEYFVEFMDWKRNPSAENLKSFEEVVRVRYSSMHLDAIVTTDDAALTFALSHRALLSNAQIIFCGVNEKGYADLVPQGTPKVAGVIENFHIDETLRLATRLVGTINTVYLVADNSESARSTAKLAVDSINRVMGQGIRVIDLGLYSFPDMLATLGKAGKGSIVLATSYANYVPDSGITLENATRYISNASAVPVFSLYDFAIGNGALGGSIIGGNTQGELSAAIVARVLDGTPQTEIIRNIPEDLVVDYGQMKRFGIPEQGLPPGIRIVGKPASPWRDYWNAIAKVLPFILVLIALIITLLAEQFRLRRAKRELSHSNAELAKSELQFRLAAEGSNDIIWFLDFAEERVFVSERWEQLMGHRDFPFDDILNNKSDFIHADDLERVHRIRDEYMEGRSPLFDAQFRIRDSNGDYRWIQVRGKVMKDSGGRPQYMAGSMSDISASKSLDDRIRYLAYHDSSTGLPNRSYLSRRFASDEGLPSEFAMLFLDIDNFSFINSTYGHHFGDTLIVLFVRRLRDVLRADDIIVRVGGDEFIVIIEGPLSKAEAAANRILSALESPIGFQDLNLNVSASIGIASYPEHGAQLSELFRNADTAMFRAKKAGKRRWTLFEKDMGEELRQNVILESALRKAVEEHRLEVVYQPKMALESGRIIGFEALCRWHDEKLGRVDPSKFIRVAEESGLIVALGRWVFDSAANFLAELEAAGHKGLSMAVNVSTVQLQEKDFADSLLTIAARHGLSPKSLELEITESIVMESFHANVEKLKLLRARGFRIALDDFGTGYSSLSYLQQLPLDTLKIDKSFIDDVTDDERSASITGLIIGIGRSIGLEVVAEGVETESQLEYLSRYKCDIVQGYVYSKPLTAPEIINFLGKKNAEKSSVFSEARVDREYRAGNA